MEKQNYSFYLFCKLREIIIPSEDSYDYTFEVDEELYEQYLKSDEINLPISEYMAMEAFLKRIDIEWHQYDYSQN